MTLSVSLPSGSTEGSTGLDWPKLFQDIFENAPIGVAIGDDRLQLVWVNPVYCAMVGYTREELLSKRVHEMIHPEDLAVPLQMLSELFSGRVVHHEGERRAVRKDGSAVWVHAQVTPLCDGPRVTHFCAFLQDLSRRKAAEEALLFSERRYRLLVENGGGLIAEHFLDGRLLSVNAAMAKALGYTPREMAGRPMADFCSPTTRHAVAGYLERIAANGSDGGLLCVETRAGEERIWIYHSSLCEEPSRAPYVISHAQDVTEQERMRCQPCEFRLRDSLTGCHNRRYLAEFERKAAGSIWGCVIVDIDHFKKYNDTHGHDAGDTVLLKMARFLMLQTRAVDTVVRMGGDEFLVLLRDSDSQITGRVASRLKNAAEHAPVSFSIGWAAREDGETLDQTIARADKGLFAIRVAERSYGHARESEA